METAAERGKRLWAEYSKALPRIFGDPLRLGIGKPDPRLEGESTGHIAAYALGFLQELEARVRGYCANAQLTDEDKRAACQLLVNIGSDGAKCIQLLAREFPVPFREIAEQRSNFPCLWPVYAEHRKALEDFLLTELGLGKCHPLKLRSDHKTFSVRTFANGVVAHYIAQIHLMALVALASRLEDPFGVGCAPLSEVERLFQEVPLSRENAGPWLNVIWSLLLADCPQPETDANLRSLGNRPSRKNRCATKSSPRVSRKRPLQKAAKSVGKTSAGYVRAAIKEGLAKYLLRMLRKKDQSKPDK